MMGAARQLRSRGTKASTSATARGKQADVPKRKAFGDVSNKRQNQPNDSKKAKPAAKRNTMSALVVGGVAKLRRSARSNTDSEESKEPAPKKRLTRKKSRDEADPVETEQGPSKKRKATRKQGAVQEVEPVLAQQATGGINVEEAEDSKPRLRSRPLEAAEDVEIDKPAPRAKRSTRTAPAERETKEPLAKRVKRATAVATKPKKAVPKTSKPEAATVIKTEDNTQPEGGKRRSRPPGPNQLRGSFSESRVLCSDFVSDSNFTLVRVPFDASMYTAGFAKHDEKNRLNPLQVSNYATDLFQRLYHSEEQFQPHLYMENQDEINSMMRAILVDWLVEVHMKFKLAPESLYLCINIIDRYCSAVEVERRKLQLVGVTALLLACKYEEIYPPEVRDCVYITDRAYTRQQVLDMEQDIVKTLKFQLTVPTGYPFLVRYLVVVNCPSGIAQSAAQYYMERTLQEYEFIQYRPSLIAASAVWLALNNPRVRFSDGAGGRNSGIPDSLLEYTGYTKEEILVVGRKIAEVIGEEVVTASQRQLVACKKKFDCERYYHVSLDMIDPGINGTMR